ncbi:DUF6098 family protein [Streptomyces himalayensis]|uniref:Uncharacterized protein n=1 Tax=Streptomyces himalayensis subsp. himalayensis TaxID=2756131 RepID=A0A7W0IDY6_9ACTN|nr:DUF6098 family protein [Streptomyces himalayensis]MBA2951739.1 hypothetical protein [Streptomyces himalayensis subsp. himalayensis]
MTSNSGDDLPTVGSLDELCDLVAARHLYVRWSTGPAKDLQSENSTDELTGVPMPGLSVNCLVAEDWWGDRPLRLWVARRLYDYSHLRWDKEGEVRPWVLTGDEVARGPDNEPLVCNVRPVGWIGLQVIDEAKDEVGKAAGQDGQWGPMRR